MKRYQLYVYVDGYWEMLRGIDADSHITAFQMAIDVLDHRYASLPIRLEQDCEMPQFTPAVEQALI